MIDFDERTGTADLEYQDASVPVAIGLVVAEKANRSNDLVIESASFVDSTRGMPLVLFIEASDEDPNVSKFANAEAYQRAMDWLRPPTEAEALAWEAQRIGERLETWAPLLAEAGL